MHGSNEDIWGQISHLTICVQWKEFSVPSKDRFEEDIWEQVLRLISGIYYGTD